MKNSLMMLWRCSNYLYRHKFNSLAGCVYRIIRILFQCEIPPSVTMGDGSLFIHNGLGCVVHPQTIIGRNCKIYQNVTLGGRNGRGTPILEDDVFVGPGACILGGVTIGKGAIIGANAVIVHDVKGGGRIVSAPSRVLE